jgi:hypothetical protein
MNVAGVNFTFDATGSLSYGLHESTDSGGNRRVVSAD